MTGLAIVAAILAGAAQAEPAEVWAVGDVATPGKAATRVARMVRAARPDRFLYLGDVYERGTAEEFRLLYHPRLGRLAPVTEPTIGNHEWPNRFRGFYPYWREQKGRRQRPWSRTRIAGWELLNLNSEAAHGRGSTQLRWVANRLRETRTDCRIAFWHRPRYSAGAYGDDASMEPLWRRLAGHARIVLSGHDHNLQRHRPRRGLVQYVAGAGGRARYPLEPAYRGLAFGRDDVDGALRILLRPGAATLEFRSAGGGLLDRSRVSCTSG